VIPEYSKLLKKGSVSIEEIVIHSYIHPWPVEIDSPHIAIMVEHTAKRHMVAIVHPLMLGKVLIPKHISIVLGHHRSGRQKSNSKDTQR